jgi:ABC-type thiamin/hydroxymethylpyrimidine transport system permease subunit
LRRNSLHRTPYGGFPILVTLGKKRSKKTLKLAVFGVQVAALLIDFFATEFTEENT